MAYKLSEAWAEEYYGPFVRRDGSQTTLMGRMVEEGFVKYTAIDGTKYHASGRPDDGPEDLEIDGKYDPVVVARKKKKKPSTPRQDTRLAHLLKLQEQARRDVARYVSRKWAAGQNIKYRHHGKVCRGVVASHDPPMSTVIIFDEQKRKLRVPYTNIIDRKARTL